MVFLWFLFMAMISVTSRHQIAITTVGTLKTDRCCNSLPKTIRFFFGETQLNTRSKLREMVIEWGCNEDTTKTVIINIIRYSYKVGPPLTIAKLMLAKLQFHHGLWYL